MNIPYNLLPLHVSRNGFSRKQNHHTIYAAKEDLIIVGEIKQDDFVTSESSTYNSLDLAEYLVLCANEFPKAIQLLGKVKKIIEVDGFELTDGQCMDAIYELDINSYINELNLTVNTEETIINTQKERVKSILKLALKDLNSVPNNLYCQNYKTASEIQKFLKEFGD
jgi:hypothetical protein